MQAASILEMNESAAWLSATSLHFPGSPSLLHSLCEWLLTDPILICPAYLIILSSSSVCMALLESLPSESASCLSDFFSYSSASQVGHCEFAYGVTLYTHPSTEESLWLLSLMHEYSSYKGVCGPLSYFEVLYGHILSLLAKCPIDIVNLNSFSPNLFHQKPSPNAPFSSVSLSHTSFRKSYQHNLQHIYQNLNTLNHFHGYQVNLSSHLFPSTLLQLPAKSCPFSMLVHGQSTLEK